MQTLLGARTKSVVEECRIPLLKQNLKRGVSEVPFLTKLRSLRTVRSLLPLHLTHYIGLGLLDSSFLHLVRDHALLLGLPESIDDSSHAGA